MELEMVDETDREWRYDGRLGLRCDGKADEWQRDDELLLVVKFELFKDRDVHVYSWFLLFKGGEKKSNLRYVIQPQTWHEGISAHPHLGCFTNATQMKVMNIFFHFVVHVSRLYKWSCACLIGWLHDQMERIKYNTKKLYRNYSAMQRLVCNMRDNRADHHSLTVHCCRWSMWSYLTAELDLEVWNTNVIYLSLFVIVHHLNSSVECDSLNLLHESRQTFWHWLLRISGTRQLIIRL